MFFWPSHWHKFLKFVVFNDNEAVVFWETKILKPAWWVICQHIKNALKWAVYFDIVNSDLLFVMNKYNNIFSKNNMDKINLWGFYYNIITTTL